MKAARDCQRGVVLPVALIFLAAVTLLAVSAVQLSLQEQKAFRGYRDRVLAFQAAEAALLDAEIDIQDATASARSRSAMFAEDRAIGFPGAGESLCHSGAGNPVQGLCRLPADGLAPAWLAFNIADIAEVTAVHFGQFTGRSMPIGSGVLPIAAPRYLIELVPDLKGSAGAPEAATAATAAAAATAATLTSTATADYAGINQPAVETSIPGYSYRITAVGYGAMAGNYVVLQSSYRKRRTTMGTGIAAPRGMLVASQRGDWREIANWRELHAAANRSTAAP